MEKRKYVLYCIVITITAQPSSVCYASVVSFKKYKKKRIWKILFIENKNIF